MSAQNTVKKLIRDLERAGYVVTRTRRGHLRIAHPLMTGIVIGSATPSDHRAWRNMHAMLKRQLVAANDN